MVLGRSSRICRGSQAQADLEFTLNGKTLLADVRQVAFGKVIDGDLHVVELGSWLQPSKVEYYLQRLSVMLRQRKTAKA